MTKVFNNNLIKGDYIQNNTCDNQMCENGVNEYSKECEKVSLVKGEYQYNDDFLDKFEKDVVEGNFLPEIKENLLAMVNRARELEIKRIQENRMKEKKRILSEEKRRNKLILLDKIINQIKSDKNNIQVEAIIEGIRKLRFKDGRVCPHCGYIDIWKYGKYDGKQRYKCKSEECGKTFSDITLSPMYYSKKGIHKWNKYMKCMVKGLSLKECSHMVGINIATAFFWRHKIMDGLRINMGSGCIGGIVEMGHMAVIESVKGNVTRNKNGGVFNKGRRCGIKNKYTLIFNDNKPKVDYVVCAVDRKGNMIIEACNRRVNKITLEKIFYGKINSGTVLCTEGNRHYHLFAQSMDLGLARGCTGDNNQKYHIENLMGMKREVNQWLSSFNGVSSKYLTNYLYWYRWIKEKNLFNKNYRILNYFTRVRGYTVNVMAECCDDNSNATESLFLESHCKYSFMIIKDFKKRKPIYVTAA
ncbi:IS1595 family transposase [Oceanirhabdus sp. W0125-5]|uniref:IS1595 family transposase n=1 Tax=Oceanirhabdus sp. W0125-5 TaxID=2999116 RepID=UPI0022F2D92E|nr:IS1595 family transposase [Oceanirhabdus sp. W0125-5]WBW95720.1 IS1595 family transposase [Oceanirhabdus sp. W0125-5]